MEVILCWQCFYLKKFFIGAVKLTRNPDRDKCSHSEYGMSFDVRGTIMKWNISDAITSLSVLADNKRKIY